MIVVGIDPGKHTGFAEWLVKERRFKTITTLLVHEAIAAIELIEPNLVIFEDARQRSYFLKADLAASKYGAGVREGAGAAKRDATIWEDYLKGVGIPFIARKPAAGSTKWPAEKFKRLTGWGGRTSEHARDAGVLVFGLNESMVRSLLLQAKGGAK